MGQRGYYLYMPSYGAQGITEYSSFDTGLISADTELKNCYNFRTSAILTATSFSGTNMYAATITATTFSGTNVHATTITATTFSGTNAYATTITATTFSGVNVYATTVTATNLTGTTISATNVYTTTITATTVSATTFSGMTVLKGTSSVATLGTVNQLTADGAFTTTSGWTYTGWTIAGGKATHALGNTTSLEGTTTITDDKMHDVIFTISGRTAGSIGVFLNTGECAIDFSANTTYQIFIRADLTNGNVKFTPTSDFDGSLDNVSIHLVTESIADATVEASDGTSNPLQCRTGGDTNIGVFIGNRVGASTLATSLYNVGIGYLALSSNVYGTENMAIGPNALENNYSGHYNVAIGRSALSLKRTGSGNVAIGGSAGVDNYIGASNVFIGYGAGAFSNGSGNVFIGYNAGKYETGSDKLFIDNRGRTNEADARVKALIYGVFADDVANQSLFINAASVGIQGTLTATSISSTDIESSNISALWETSLILQSHEQGHPDYKIILQGYDSTDFRNTLVIENVAAGKIPVKITPYGNFYIENISGTDYERADLGWVSNTFKIRTAKAGSGTLRNIEIGAANTIVAFPGTSLSAGIVSATNVYATTITGTTLSATNCHVTTVTATTADINGDLTALVPVISVSADTTLSASQVKGQLVLVTATATITLPAVVVGSVITVYSTTAAAVMVDPNTNDRIILNGAAGGNGKKITSASAAGNFVTLIGDSADGWMLIGRSGTWTMES